MLSLTANQIFILTSLAKKDMYGLEIISFINKFETSLVLGSLYNTLKNLEKKNLIKSFTITESDNLNSNKRRFYKLTTKGKDEIARFKNVIEQITNSNTKHKEIQPPIPNKSERYIQFLDLLEKATILTTMDKTINFPLSQNDICKYYKNEKSKSISHVGFSRRIKRNIKTLNTLLSSNNTKWPYIRQHLYPFNES